MFYVCLGVIAVSIILLIVGIVIVNVALIIIPILLIALTVAGFFFFYNKAEENQDDAINQKIASFIKDNSELEMGEVAQKFNLSKSDATKHVYECFKQNMIEGYTLQGDFIRAVHLTEMSAGDGKQAKGDVVHCTGCGATYVDTGKYKECPYCGKVSQ